MQFLGDGRHQHDSSGPGLRVNREVERNLYLLSPAIPERRVFRHFCRPTCVEHDCIEYSGVTEHTYLQQPSEHVQCGDTKRLWTAMVARWWRPAALTFVPRHAVAHAVGLAARRAAEAGLSRRLDLAGCAGGGRAEGVVWDEGEGVACCEGVVSPRC